MGTIVSVWAKVIVITLIKAPHCLKGHGRVTVEFGKSCSPFCGAMTVVSVGDISHLPTFQLNTKVFNQCKWVQVHYYV